MTTAYHTVQVATAHISRIYLSDLFYKEGCMSLFLPLGAKYPTYVNERHYYLQIRTYERD